MTPPSPHAPTHPPTCSFTTFPIANSTIAVHAYGESNQRVPTADGVRELQNRRVEITYGPGSGN